MIVLRRTYDVVKIFDDRYGLVRWRDDMLMTSIYHNNLEKSDRETDHICDPF